MNKVIIVIFSLMLLVGCNQNKVKHNTKLEESIFSIVKNENISEIDIKPLTNFTWDKAFIFRPYTPQKSMDEQLGVHFNDKSSIDMRDDIYLLVFLNEEKVVQYAEIKRQGSDFHMGQAEYLTPTNALINIHRPLKKTDVE